VVGDTGKSNRGHLPKVMVIDLGDRDVELLLQAHYKGFNDAPFILERPAPRDMDL